MLPCDFRRGVPRAVARLIRIPGAIRASRHALLAPIAAMQKEISQAALAKFANFCGGARTSIATLVDPTQT